MIMKIISSIVIASGLMIAAHQTKPTFMEFFSPQRSEDSLIAEGAVLKKISAQFSFTEGASVDKKGNVFFTDQPNDKIWKYDVHGRLSVFLDKCGRSNGTYFDRKGNLLTCADEHNELWSISPRGKVTVLLSDFGGHRFNGPNDLWEDPSGGIYFTDPYYQRPYWDRTSPDIKGEKIYFLPAGAKQATVVADDLRKPNGIVGSPDGKFLFVADIGAGKTYKYSIEAPGKLSGKHLFCEQGSDGMTLDEDGNVYLTGNGVNIFNKEGKHVETIAVPENWTANLCFGGKKKNVLFITASVAIYTIDMKVKGVE
jgi:gluconolactonase